MPSMYSMIKYAWAPDASKSYTPTMCESDSMAAVRASSSPGISRGERASAGDA